MVRLWVFVGGLLLVLVGAAFVAPSFIDWEPYRARFEAEVSALLGRDVEVGGIESARVLPFPSITFTDVTVAAEGDGAAVAIDRLSLDAELTPFLRGEILIFDARLDSPRIDVRLDADGRLRWTPPTSGRVDPAAVSIERLAIADGTVRIVDGSGRPFEARDVDLSVSADTLLGPWSAAGALTAAGSRYTLEATTGLYEPELRDGVRVLVTLGAPALPSPLNLFGTATLADGSLAYEGEFTSSGTPERPYALTGTFAVDPTEAAIEEYRLAIGTADDPYVVTGEASVAGGDTPGFTLVARGQRLDTARLGEASGGGGAERLAALQRLALNAPRPGVDGSIDVSLPAIVFEDTTVRDLTLRAVAEAGDWRVERFAAAFPGRTDVRGSGRLAADGSGTFEGDLAVVSRQPTGLAGWLGNPVDPSLRDLDRLGFEARFAARDGVQRLDDLTLAIDDERLVGSARVLADGIAVELAGPSLDLDAARAAALATLGGAAAGDVEVAIELERATIDGVVLEDMALRGTWGASRAEIASLSVGDVRGTSVEASGTISGIDGEASELAVTLRTADATETLSLADGRIDAPWVGVLAERADRLGPLDVEAQLAWLQRDAVGFEATVGAGEVRWALGGSLSGEPSEARLAALSAEGEGREGDLLRQLGIEARTDGRDARLSIAYERTANGSRLDASGSADSDAIALTYLEAGDEAVADARLDIASVATPAALAGLDWSGVADAPLDGRVTATREGGLWTVAIEEAQLGDTLLTGRVVGDEGRWQGELTTGVIDAAAMAAILSDGAADPVIGTARLLPVDLLLLVEARAVTFPGSVVARDATFRAALSEDSVGIEAFEGAVEDGRLTGSVSLRETFGEALLALRFGVEGVDATRFAPTASSRLAAGSLVAAGSVEATGRTMSQLLRSATGAGEAAVIDPVIAGLDPFALARVYERVDASSDAIEAEAVGTVIREEIAGGGFAPDALAIDWTVSGGTLRATLAEAEDGGTTLAGVADVDLSTGEVVGRATIRLSVPDDRAAGGAPVVRLRLEDGQTTYDVGSLTGFLNLRAFEIERDRVAALRAALLEEQRLRRETLLFSAREREAAAREVEAAARASADAAANARAQAPPRAPPSSPPSPPRLDFTIPIE